MDEVEVYFKKEVVEFAERLSGWRDALRRAELPAALPFESSHRALVEYASQIERRYREGPTAPARLAFFGPTGAGKSKLFSSLIGPSGLDAPPTDRGRAPASPSGFRRPYTRRPWYFVHEAFRDLSERLRGEVLLHSRVEWRDVILIDTPDFDSVEAENRAEAERIYLEADAFLFVTDVQKYADASTWEYLDRIFAEGKSCRVLLNKLRSETVLDDFRDRLHERWGERGTSVLGPTFPELPIDDETLLPTDEPGLVELRDRVSELVRVGERSRVVVRDAFRLELERLLGRARELESVASTLRVSAARLVESLDGWARQASEKVRDLVSAQVDPAVRDEMYGRVLERFERMDLLRYPRRLLALPFQGAKQLYDRFRGARGSTEPPSETPVTATDSFQILEGAILAFADKAREGIAEVPGLAELLDRETFRGLVGTHEDLREEYAAVFADFRDWVRTAASEAAAEISGESKARFILAQVIFNTVLVGVQIKTFGVFTLAELATDGVLSPFVAKAVGMALSSEKVREFEKRAHAEHHRRVVGLIDDRRARFADFVAEATHGLEEMLGPIHALSSYADRAEDITEAFALARYRRVTDDRASAGSEPEGRRRAEP